MLGFFRCVPVLALWGCGPSLDLGPPAPHAALAVTVEPAGTPEGAPPVLRLRVAGAFGRSDLADFRLFRGALSAYHLGRLRQGELPKTLLEREVPRVAWAEGADVIVAPAAALDAGIVALASPDLGLLAEVVVDPTLASVLERAWPPPEQPFGRGPMIFCGSGAAGLAETPVTLEPSGAVATVRPGLGGDTSLERACARLEPAEELPDGSLVLPPPVVGGLALEPLPLLIGPVPRPANDCEPAELAFGPACAVVEDDRVRLRAAGAASFWILREPEERLFTLTPGKSLVARGLAPGRRARLSGTVFDLDGRSERVELDVLAAAAGVHVVINEVLANPVGAERTSEWLELVNDGREAVEVGGFELRDATGAARLPDGVLAPGELALVVADGFAPDAELDLVAPAGVRRLVVPSLGSGGLTNGGEPLRLLDREGRVLSRFPAVAAAKPGQSVARVQPEAPDDELGSFRPHADPGASPGQPNAVAPTP